MFTELEHSALLMVSKAVRVTSADGLVLAILALHTSSRLLRNGTAIVAKAPRAIIHTDDAAFVAARSTLAGTTSGRSAASRLRRAVWRAAGRDGRVLSGEGRVR